MKVEIVTSLVPLQKKQLTLSPQEQTCHAQSKSQFLHFVGLAVLNGEDLDTTSAFQTQDCCVGQSERSLHDHVTPVPPPHTHTHIACPREDLYRDK